jgi:hypothetical protein
MANPRDCRNNAEICVDLASSSGDANFQSTLFALARKWENIAEELEENDEPHAHRA